ncbi:Cof-type HAD-IIB family hydrolase [Borreliella burgdorferi]|uniref:Haloacid dehalogenase-like hydrolase n=1 Tax=Borreliella burgdorferi 118a TaxID=476210 RepID=A0A7U8EZG8_BORBG|nr:Cof-type HAD-IIB family hydrolase [Borreliella burgdorferi]AXK70411.1 HMP-PP hydrolase (pyridoxal phosphatase) Cof [Borreliella burgdorferi]EEE18230.1 haloacid dehalogenase-like hydrolase [Borreliella burgdorferi 72a]EEF83660.1 haloacid dehalogenase-like hydrolase [Borreliella burgdorferi CA-11.2A]EEG99346.1 haloacid dehalogenase-like hydrolase [Borreliella burgdorferi 118a]EEH00122.1 haloacid dehalogenase-like hydrolase [Borreliella burgdorferi 94a]
MNSNYKRYKMLVFDLDGTLLNNNHEIAFLTLEVLLALKKDFKIIIATGRRLSEVKNIRSQLKEIGINENYLVTANGAEVFLQENLIFRYAMNYDLVKEILKIHTDNVDVNLYTFDTWYSNADVKSPIMKHFIKDLGLNVIIGDLTKLNVDSVSKIVYYCDDLAILNKLDNEIKIKDFQDTRVFFSSKDLLEVTNINANKYNAIKNIAFLESIPLCDVLAFGDNNNDYEMLKNLGKGVLMKNANEFLKINLAKNEITRFSNNEDGVARFLIDFFKLNIKY